MTFIADIDPEVHADLDAGCIVFRMHPDHAETIAGLLRRWHAEDPADEDVAEFTETLIDQTHEAVWALGWDPHTGAPIQ